ncbi:MAG: aldehyde ferredoxin oxidoreductase C-terminal domain-containing protein, partial [Chloroflexota bacterium]|nr:aldehyde ferredoxin oxidoreductase C-terminal domain-containing protein [Chloroflexota bacterium]
IGPQDAQEWFGEPLSLEWGSYKTVEKVIDAIALHKGKLGDLFQGGLVKGAQRLEDERNIPALQYAIYGKGGGACILEVRQTPSWAINQAVASRGADHLKGFGTLDKINRADISQHYFGTPDGAKPMDITLKGAGSAKAEDRCAIISSLGLCNFLVATDPLLYPHEVFCRAVETLTGLKLSPQELEMAGRRIVNLEKAFNSRLGMRREDDKLCHRWMEEPIADGAGKGWKAGDYLEKLKDEYYQTHGWDVKTSLQTRKLLEEVGLAEVAQVLEKEGALAQ